MKSRFGIPQPLRTPFLFSFLISFSLALITLVMYFRLQPQVPLFYSLPRSTQHLVAKEWLFLLPSISWIISFIHLIIAKSAQKADLLLLKIFTWTTVGMQFLLSLSLLRIIIIIN